MVFNYVPGGYHSHSISSVWQCNSLCPAAVSAKLRQFTCWCSYTALEEADLPSILCIHVSPGTQSLTSSNMCCHMQNRVKGLAVLVLCFCGVLRDDTSWYFCTIQEGQLFQCRKAVFEYSMQNILEYCDFCCPSGNRGVVEVHEIVLQRLKYIRAKI